MHILVSQHKLFFFLYLAFFITESFFSCHFQGEQNSLADDKKYEKSIFI